jgi:hypothetical protein
VASYMDVTNAGECQRIRAAPQIQEQKRAALQRRLWARGAIPLTKSGSGNMVILKDGMLNTEYRNEY